MANIEYISPQPQHIRELARICFEAFTGLHDHHRVPRDFPVPDIAEKLIGLVISRPDIYGVAAQINGRLVGSNFLSLMDEVSGVGPITIDPVAQGKGIGRGLMTDVLNHARQQGIQQVRLVQEAINTVSSTLYTSLGFEIREPLGAMSIGPALAADPTIREATENDLSELDALTRKFFKTSRLTELREWPKIGFPLFARERDGKLRGYFIPGKLGHGVAETIEDTLALLGEAGRRLPPEIATYLLPMRNSQFYRAALQAGHHLNKVLTYMTLGPYTPPEAVWMPSYFY
jgi:GNAT superfamily N-acetyltransferase